MSTKQSAGLFADRVRFAIVDINRVYGRGNVASVNLRAKTFVRRIPVSQRGWFAETRKFRLSHTKAGLLVVHALSHKKVTP